MDCTCSLVIFNTFRPVVLSLYRGEKVANYRPVVLLTLVPKSRKDDKF